MEEALAKVTGAIVDFAVQMGTNEMNMAIVLGTYGLIYALKPAAHAFVWSEHFGKHRTKLYHVFRWGKRLAATIWCSVAVWIPGAQPDLCGPAMAEGCQSVSMRITTALFLGVVMTWSYGKVMGMLEGEPKAKFKVKCINCKATSRVNDMQQPCPACEVSLHELVKVKT